MVFITCLVFGTLISGIFANKYKGRGGWSSGSSDTCIYSDSYDLSISGSTQISLRNMVGRINIGDSFSLSFNLTINSMHGNEWVSILHIGESDTERSPGIWLSPSSTTLHICLSDIDNWNTYNNIDQQLEIGQTYNIKLTVSNDGQVIGYLDNIKQFSYNDTIHLTRFRSPVFIGDPWYTPVDGIVDDLIIESFDDECASTTSSTSSTSSLLSLLSNDFESFNQNSELINYNNNNGGINGYDNKLVFAVEPSQLVTIIAIFILIGAFSFLKCVRDETTKDEQYSSVYGSV